MIALSSDVIVSISDANRSTSDIVGYFPLIPLFLSADRLNEWDMIASSSDVIVSISDANRSTSDSSVSISEFVDVVSDVTVYYSLLYL